ncbi:restriction endonuclease subunit S [Flavobacterium sp. F372]|uniref:Restriction endonuclease subunit S n=1 Tax=Flavobacterium bernardetii TaxID=2813823 RepID=A0ABR7IVH5_9FLAO|nr:restriction endonuclease subunit S [Flavobacterium bernardetii]MBC5833799.1 restriction endonuclease subunit S [Flavobacterium bernardetii]NHF69032.1 restriction endonuclease subunit S [Flavobacterium bernardetii]
MQKIKLDDVLKYEQPTKYIVETENYNNDYKTPVLTAGKSFILGYTNEEKGLFTNVPVIIFDDFTTAFHYVDFPFKVKSSAMKILKAVENKASLRYLYYKMQTISIDKDLHKRYWISKYSQIDIELPNLPTQQKIANILDKADELSQYNKQLIEKYEALTQSLFLDMFGDPVRNEKGWEKTELRNVTSKIGSGSTPRGGKEAYHSEGISLIRSLNIYDNEFKYKNLAFINDDQAKKLKNVTVESNDVLFNITGASVCRCTVVPDEVLPARVNQHVSILRPISEKLHPLFLSHLLISENIKNHLLGVGSAGGAVMEAITKEQLEKFKIPLPPIKLQIQFAERVAIIETQKQQAQEALVKSEALFQGLLQQAFNGELN